MIGDTKKTAAAIAAKLRPAAEADEDDLGPGDGLDDLARDVLAVLDPYGAPSEAEPREDETEMERKQREISRRADEERHQLKVRLLAQSLKAFCQKCCAMPQGEGEHE